MDEDGERLIQLKKIPAANFFPLSCEKEIIIKIPNNSGSKLKVLSGIKLEKTKKLDMFIKQLNALQKIKKSVFFSYADYF